jgi:uncharacterized repeat protein (TIGR01451 family)
MTPGRRICWPRHAVMVTAAAIFVTLGLSAASASAAPGNPGVPGSPQTVFTENFENVPNQTNAQLVANYTGAGSLAMTYTGDPAWLNSAACNGVIASWNATTSAGSCPTSIYNAYIRPIARGMGAALGGGDSNHVMSDVTISGFPAPATPAATLQTVKSIPLPATGRYITFSVSAGAVTCNGAKPLLRFFLLDGANTIAGSNNAINACTDPRGSTVGGTRVGTYASDASNLVNSSQIGLKLTNDQTSGSGNDYAVDNISVLDATPQLDKEFGPDTTPGTPATLTFTITNTSDLAAKNGWSFTDNLPSGLQVASPNGATTTCPSGAITATSGSSTIGVSGNLASGQASCTAKVKVVAPNSGSYQNCASNLSSVVGLDAPTCDTLNVGSLVSCTSDPSILNTGYNVATGGVLPSGANDADWRVAGPFFTPTGTTPPALASPPPAGAVFGPAVVGNQAPGAWAASPYGNAQWISQAGTGAQNGDWYYRYQFRLDPSVDPSDFSLQMNFLADNDVAEVYVNGVAQSGQTTGIPQNTSSPYTYQGYTFANRAQTTLNNNWQTGLNSIVVQIKSFGPAEGFDAQIVPSPICPVDLHVTKTASPNPYTPGQPLTYTVTVTNDGPGTARGFTVSDPLPAQLASGGFTWTCAATGDSACKTSGSGDISDGPSGSYQGPKVSPGGSLTYTVTGTVPAGTSGALSNTATVTPQPGTDDPNCTPSCSGGTNTPMTPTSDLSLAKSVNPAVADPDDQVIYTLTATNNGPDTEPNASLTDTLPAGVTYVSDDGGCNSGSLPQLTCPVGSLANTATHTVHVTVQVDSDAGGTFPHNTAHVSGTNFDTNAQNNDAAADVRVRPLADLAIEKTAVTNLGGSPPQANPGDTIAYTLSVTNNGPSDSPSETVTDTLPAGVTYVSDTASTLGGGAGCDTTNLPEISCTNLPGIASGGAPVTFQITVTADPGNGRVEINSASVDGPLNDPDTSNDKASADVLVLPLSDLSVTKTAPATVRAGQQLTYTLDWANNGPSDSPSQTAITDTLPDGVSYVSDDGGCGAPSGQVMTCNLGAVANGASGTIQITVAVGAATRGQIANTASIDGPNEDQNGANDSDTATTGVDPQLTDLQVEKTASDGVVDPGDPVSFQLRVTNNGPDDSPSEQVTDTLPDGLTYVSDDASCDATSLPQITCDVAGLLNGESATITIDTTVDLDAGGTVQDNDVTVTGPGNDTNPTNNSDTARVLVTPLSDLFVNKSVSDGSIRAGHELTYTLDWGNAGPTDSPSQTTVTDTLPAGVTYVSDDAGCDTASLPELTCNLGAVPNGTGGTIHVTVSVDPSTRGQIENTASIDGPNNDQDPSNNSDAADTDVDAGVSDLELTKTVPPGPFKVGDQIPYKLTLKNNGPDDAAEVVVTDTLPAGLTYVSDDSGCDTSALPTVECKLGTLDNGASREVNITTRLDSASGTSISNTALARSANDDPDPADASASAVAGVAAAKTKTSRCFYGHRVTILGTNRPERIVGTPGRDVINGKGGNDVILGRGGNDLICGGGGDDLILGGLGNDRVKGSLGDDIIRGNLGDDWLRGAPGNDRITGRRGNDRLMGNDGNDHLWGRQGNDFLLGGPGFDWGWGGPGANRGLGLDRAFGILG